MTIKDMIEKRAKVWETAKNFVDTHENENGVLSAEDNATYSRTKTVNIDGKDVTFRASAAIPRIYRNKFHRDIYKDLHDLQKSIDENDPENSALDSFSLELFEDISYIMAKHADPQGVPDTPDEWLDQFGTFSIYQVLPEIIELWGLNVQTQVESKKNFERLTGK